jgi:hypothetical protein
MYTPLPLSLITVKYLYTTVLDFVTGGAQVEENPGTVGCTPHFSQRLFDCTTVAIYK